MQHCECVLDCAQLSDNEEIAALEAISFPPDEAASLATITKRLTEAGRYFYCYRDLKRSNSLVGFVNGTCIVGNKINHESMTNHEPSGRTLVIHSVTIHPDFRRKGLGSTMLKVYIQKMRHEPSIDTIVLLSKVHMLSFYTDCGFSIVRASDVAHGQV